MGFCFFNNVAIAAKQLLKRPEMRRVREGFQLWDRVMIAILS